MNKERIQSQLAIIAATARIAEMDIAEGKHWRGDFTNQLSKIESALVACKNMSKDYEQSMG